MSLRLDDYTYELPEALIAQEPLYPRDHSRLMVVHENREEIIHKHFYDICEFLSPGDVLVVNNSKVIPARLYGKKVPTGGKVEVLLLEKKPVDNTWECLVRPGRRVRKGTIIDFSSGKLSGEIIEDLPEGRRVIKFDKNEDLDSLIEEIGKMPLPPYIKKDLEDQQRYQTVYAKWRGSSAAPTAGLHFTDELIERIKAKGVKIANVTLHVGLGTFRPVETDDISKHKMHSEYYEISKETVNLLNDAKENNHKIVAVGTTSVRVLESSASDSNNIIASSGQTDIFIYPGYKWKFVDALITNFHLPKSSLLMLVSSFLSREQILKVYNVAVEEKYRFFSFGDAMLLMKENNNEF
jgi:S-adenosylmethionine:tRNA ribosyltransferase-isomerase